MVLDIVFIAGTLATLGLRLVAGRNIRFWKVHTPTFVPLLTATAAYGLAIFVLDVSRNVLVSYPFEHVPPPIQIAAVVGILGFLNDSLDATDIRKWAPERAPLVGLLFIVAGICYALGAAAFGYGASQYVTAIFFVLLGVAFSSTDIWPTYKLYSTCAVLIMVAAGFSLYVHCMLRFGAFDLSQFPDVVRDHQGISIFAILFTLIQGIRHSVFPSKTIKRLAKIVLAAVVAGFLYRHPDLQSEALSPVKDLLAYVPLTLNPAVAAYCLVRIVRTAVSIG